MSEKLTNALKDLFDGEHMEFEAFARLNLLEDTIRRSGKSSEAAMRVNINIYGPRSDRDDVGKKLSDARLFLQDPDHHRMEYSNPHIIQFSEFEESEDDEDVSNETGFFSGPESSQDKEFTQEIAEVFSSLKRVNGLQRIQGNDKIKIPLLQHQEEALDFMMQRETGAISTEYCLWQETAIDDEQCFRHSITGRKEYEQPDESGGGILADEMGMGKSLTTLALIMKTMDEASQWIGNAADTGPDDLAKEQSRATLIIVPSPVLINGWVREIDTHLNGKISVMRYHGRKRKDLIKNINGCYIVITTYRTLAVEHGKAKCGKERSPLHGIAWYRVVLDEGL